MPDEIIWLRLFNAQVHHRGARVVARCRAARHDGEEARGLPHRADAFNGQWLWEEARVIRQFLQIPITSEKRQARELILRDIRKHKTRELRSQMLLEISRGKGRREVLGEADAIPEEGNGGRFTGGGASCGGASSASSVSSGGVAARSAAASARVLTGSKKAA
eukprot:1698587-Prymnesium_polylepis.2